MSRRTTSRLAADVAVMAVVAGCGGSGSGGTNPNGHARSGFNAGINGVRNPWSTTGGTLNLIAVGDCDYYDPART